jgi:hypothetical protein
MNEWRIVDRFTARVRDVCSLQNVKTGFEAQALLLSVYRHEEGGGDWTKGTNGYSVRLPFRRNSIFLFWTAVCLLNLILDHNGQPRMDLQPLVCMKTCIRTYCFTLRPIYFCSKTNQMHDISNSFYFGTTLYMFRTVSPSIIRSLRLYVYLTLYIQSWTPDDGRKDHPKHVECCSKMKWIWDIVHLDGFTVEIYYDAGPTNVKLGPYISPSAAYCRTPSAHTIAATLLWRTEFRTQIKQEENS